MVDKHLARFRRQVALFNSTPAQKLVRMPVRLLYTKFLEHSAKRLHKSVAVTAGTFWGEKMTVIFPEQVSVSIARYGVFEEGLTSIVMQRLKPGMVFFDVGAHFGYFSLLAAWLVGDSGQVHSFEPTPSTFEILKRNLGGRRNVRLNQLAAHAHESTLELSDFGTTFAAFNTLAGGKLDDATKAGLSPKRISVRATSIDQYVRETGAKPDFIKIDAEGAEMEILRGMTHVLGDARPAISLEVGDVEPSEKGGSRQILQYLRDKGYTALEYADGAVVPHTFKDRYEYDNLLFVPETSSGNGPASHG